MLVLVDVERLVFRFVLFDVEVLMLVFRFSDVEVLTLLLLFVLTFQTECYCWC